MLLHPTLNYDLKCPDTSQRVHRAKGLCMTGKYLKYSCLFDGNLGTYVESCEEEPDFVRPGKIW